MFQASSMEAKGAEANQMGSMEAKGAEANLFKTLWEALVFLIKNWMLALIFTLLYFISFFFSIFQSLSTTPLLTNLLNNLASLSKLKPPNPDFYQVISVILTELREITIIEAVFFVAIFFASTLLLTSTLCFICLTYADNRQPSLKELFSKFRRTWKGAMITQFYVTIFIHMSVLLMFVLIGGFVLFSMNSSVFLVVSSIILILAVILYLYLAMIWSLSVVVSVEDDGGLYGLAAILKATEIIKWRRRKGISINIFIISLNMAASFFAYKELSLSEMKKMVILGILFVVAAVMNVFYLAVITVFYFECKQGAENQCGFGYSSLPSEALIHSEIP